MASNSGLQLQHSTLAEAHMPSADALLYITRRLDSTNFMHGLPWHDCDYYPARERQGRRSAVRAANLLIHANYRSVGLCRQPTELLMWIGDQLSGPVLLALRATCRQMRFCVPLQRAPYALPVSRDDRIRFVLQMYSDRYRKMAYCEIYRAQSTPLAQTIPCSFCLALHPHSAFVDLELGKSPYARICKGAVGYLRICQHRAHRSINSLELLRRFNGNPPLISVICSDATHLSPNHYLRSEYLQPKLTRGLPYEADVLRVRKGFILNFSISGHAKWSMMPGLFPAVALRSRASRRGLQRTIASILTTRTEYICPHLRTSSPNLWDHESPKPKDVLHDFYALKDGWDMYGEDGWARLAVCGVPNCETRFGHASIHVQQILSWMNEEAMVFQIWRRCPIGDARDKRWLAQLESI